MQNTGKPMTYDSKIHHRRSIRLKNYDYSRAGAYFITICTHNRECLFGQIADGEMVLNNAGRIVSGEWRNTPVLRDNIELDEFFVMPNHIHGILMINQPCGGVLPYAPTNEQSLPDSGVLPYAPTKFQSPSKTIGAIIRGYKSSVTKQINIIRGQPGVPVWQRNYYERVIRDEKELNYIREYIMNNPSKWDEDNLFQESTVSKI
jgi:REP element-mobilizing transposase RayT